MIKRSCEKCGRHYLNRAGCIRKTNGQLVHAGQCGGDVTEETLPDIVAKIRKRKEKNKNG